MPKRYLCIGLTILLVAWLAGVGCQEQPAIAKGRRFSVPQDMLQAHSLVELTNRFKHYSEPMQCELKLSPQAEYAVLTRYPSTGVGIFEVYCYERLEQDHWILRGIQFLYHSESMKVESLNTNGILELTQDGRLLSTFMSERAHPKLRRSRRRDLVAGERRQRWVEAVHRRNGLNQPAVPHNR